MSFPPRCLAALLLASSAFLSAAEVSKTPLVLKEGGTAESPFVFDGEGMVIDLGIDVTDHEWEKSGDLWTSQGPLKGREPIAGGQLAGLFIDELPLSIPRDVAAEKVHPDRKGKCYIAPDALQPGQMGYADDGSLYFRWPRGKTPGSARLILPPEPGTSAVTIACSHIIVRNLTVKYAANDGFNIHGKWVGIRLENVRALSNADEGISAHGEVEMEVADSEIAWNGSAAGGVADVGRSITRYTRCEVHDNLGAAFYFSGKSHRVSDTVIYHQSRDFSVADGTEFASERIEWREGPPDRARVPPPALSHEFVHTSTWTENWPDDSGAMETRNVTAEIWTRAMQSVLDQGSALHIPAREKPYYLDGPLILKSGQTLTADPKAEIRLKPGSNTCLVRNENVVGFPDGPSPDDLKPDTDITIEGGIWTTLATSLRESNGNLRGASARENPVYGTHGVFLLHNVRRVSVKNITVRQSRPFAVHLGNAHEFTVEGLTLEDHRRDGVHVNGPASRGVIRRVSGVSHDDPVALNAWEWKNYAPGYGPIRDILVEDISGAPEGVPSANAIRLLPGVKRFSDGSTLDCPVENITLRRLTDIREFKLYDQPNLELGRDQDFSLGVGTLKNIRFEDLVFHRPGLIEIHAHTDGLVVEGVTIHHPLTPDWHLVAIGPKSVTYQGGSPDDPARWTEIYSPDLDCTVRALQVSGVRAADSPEELPLEQVVRVIEQKPNPDYPRTTPKGGTGKGIWIR